jgi:hypothetical protein
MTTDRAKHAKLIAGLLDFVLGKSEPTPEALACRCGGECACHVLMQLGGVICPESCPRFGKQFDGCHRCDDGHN